MNMMAAVYARKSTEQKGVAREDRSVTRQVENATAFATAKGWTVLDAHIFVDDGISGAEFAKRPGLQQLMGALKPRPPFQVLIVSEQKSLGREMSETAMTIKQLAQAGVEIFEYGQGQSLTPKNWLDKMMSAMRSGADEAHREDSRLRTHEGHKHIFERGYCVGGRLFGYRNVHVYNGVDQHGNPKRSHTVREVKQPEAAVVLRIYELYAGGLGAKAIAKRLNREQAVSPQPYKRKDETKVLPIIGWSPSTIRPILRREIYKGVAVWNKSRKRDDWGLKNQKRRPQEQWIRVKCDHLQIVPDDLWDRVASRRADTEGRTLRFADGRMSGRPTKNTVPNLLAGLGMCKACGGSIVVETSPRKVGRIPQYVCGRHRSHGTCDNATRIAVDEMNEAVLQAIEEIALTPKAVEHVVRLTERDDIREQKELLENERKQVEKGIRNLTNAIEQGGLGSLLRRLNELEERLKAIDSELASLQPVPRLAPAVIENRLAEWRRLLRQSTTQGRAVLQRIVRGRITFTPVESGYTFEAETRFDKLFTGIAVPRPEWMPTDRQGASHIGPEDTHEADYGRLLERAAGRGLKRGTSPAGFVTLWQASVSGVMRRVA